MARPTPQSIFKRNLNKFYVSLTLLWQKIDNIYSTERVSARTRFPAHSTGCVFLLFVYCLPAVVTLDGIPSNKDAQTKALTISAFKSMNNLFPEGLKNMFKPTNWVHSYNVRGSSNNFFVPRTRTEAAKRAISYRGAVMWNDLSTL